MATPKKTKPAATPKPPKPPKPAKPASPTKKLAAKPKISADAAAGLAALAAKQHPELVAPGSAAQRQFLASILADPEDKKARLVYGDLLQEQGDPRGDFIVLQSTRAELPDDDPRVPELDKQLADLQKKHKKAWTSFGENKGARWEYRRGFVEKLSLNASDLAVNGSAIFAAEPIEELNIWKIDESPVMIGTSRLAPVLALPLDRVKRLSLARCKLTKADFASLCEATTLGGVELLDLTNGGSDESPVWHLAAATSLPRLRELRIGGCMIEDEGFEQLARAPHLRFERLIAPRNNLTGAAGTAIGNATWAPTLVHLDLSSNESFGDAGLRALSVGNFPSLRSLRLDFVGLYDQAADILVEAPLFMQLESLDLPGGLTAVDRERVAAKLGARLL